MSTITIRPVDRLVYQYYTGMMEVVEGDVHVPSLHPKSLGVFPELKRLQEQAQSMGYDLDKETVAQTEADSDANGFSAEEPNWK
jgi:hypothetical protein